MRIQLDNGSLEEIDDTAEICPSEANCIPSWGADSYEKAVLDALHRPRHLHRKRFTKKSRGQSL